METDEIATDVGSVIDGERAVEIGLIDSVGGLADAMECLKGLVREKKKEKQKKKAARKINKL